MGSPQAVIFEIQVRDEVRGILTPEIRSGWTAWKPMTHLHPETREEADRKVSSLRRAMPTREFRVMEWTDDDIPF